MFVRDADEAVCLAPSASRYGAGRLDTWTNLERALRACRADAAWTRRRLVADRPEFADLCERLGLVFVGPDPAVMRLVRHDRPQAPRCLGGRGDVERPRCRVRRVAVPIIADGHGTVWPLGVSDCSCERRGEAILAESASTALTADQERDNHGRGPAAGAARRILRRRDGRVSLRARNASLLSRESDGAAQAIR